MVEVLALAALLFGNRSKSLLNVLATPLDARSIRCSVPSEISSNAIKVRIVANASIPSNYIRNRHYTELENTWSLSIQGAVVIFS